MDPKEHALRRAIRFWERGLPLPMTLMAEMARLGLDVVRLEREHRP